VRRGAIATGISIAAHAIALGWLLHHQPPSRAGSPVSVAIVGDAHASATPASNAAPVAHEPADRRPIPRARHRQVVRVDPSPSPAAEPMPIEPAPAPPAAAATDDAPAADAPAEPTVVAAPAAPPPRPRGEARPPALDRDSCIEHLDYPWRAKLLDKEGMVRLRVVLVADGLVQSATVVQRAGYGFDETAVEAVKTRCRFTPAYDDNGHAVPFVIENYHFYFRLEDFDPRHWQNRW